MNKNKLIQSLVEIGFREEEANLILHRFSPEAIADKLKHPGVKTATVPKRYFMAILERNVGKKPRRIVSVSDLEQINHSLVEKTKTIVTEVQKAEELSKKCLESGNYKKHLEAIALLLLNPKKI